MGVSGPVRDVTAINDVPAVTYDNAVNVIHPNPDHRVRLGSVRIRRENRSIPLEVVFTYYCEDMAMKIEKLAVSPASGSTHHLDVPLT